MLNTAQGLDSIRQIYDASLIPVAAVNDRGNIIYTNPAFEKVFRDPPPGLVDAHNATAYERYMSYGDISFRMYVTPLDGMSIVSYTLETSLFSKIMPVMSAAVRHAADAITRTADNLSELDVEIPEFVDSLNEIDRSIMTLLSEILIPERIASLSASDKRSYSLVSVSENANKYVQMLESAFNNQPIGVSESISAGLYSNIDVQSLFLIFSDFLASCMEGEYYTDGIGLKLRRISETRMLMTFSCSRLTRRDNTLKSSAIFKPRDYLPRNELIKIMKDKFNCTIGIIHNSSTNQITAEMDCVAPSDSREVRLPRKHYIAYSRYSDENIMLSKFGISKRY